MTNQTKFLTLIKVLNFSEFLTLSVREPIMSRESLAEESRQGVMRALLLSKLLHRSSRNNDISVSVAEECLTRRML